MYKLNFKIIGAVHFSLVIYHKEYNMYTYTQ